MKTTKRLDRLGMALLLMALLPSCGVLNNATVDDCVIGVASLLSGPFVLARDAHHYRRTDRVKSAVDGVHPDNAQAE